MANQVRCYDEKEAELFADIASVPAYFVQATSAMGVTDAQETMVFARQLEHIKKRVYEVQYPELKGRTLVPEGNEANETTEYLTYRVWEGYTMAKVIGNGDTDIPLVARSAREVSVKGYRAANGYQFTVDDLRSAQALNLPLVDDYAKQVRLGFEILREEHTAFGCPEQGSNNFGLLNHPNVPVVALPNGDWANPATTGEEILEDLNHIVTQMPVTTNEILFGDTMVMTYEARRLIATKLLNSANGSNITVLKAFQEANPGVAVETWRKCRTAAADGGARIVFYKKDPSVLEFEVAQAFEQMPAEIRAWTFTVVCRVKWFGLQVQLPHGLSYSDDSGI